MTAPTLLPADWTPTLEEYHAYPAWGSSMLSDFRDNRRLAYELYVARTLPPPPPTASMLLGTLVHALIESAANRAALPVVVVDCPDRRSKAYKEAVERAAPGQLVYPKGAIEDALAIARSILEPKTGAARAALGLLVDHPGYSEYSYRWQHSEHVEAKVRYDRLADVAGAGLMSVDLKTSRDPAPEAFAGSARNYHYVHALALRDLALERFAGCRPAAHFLVAVRSEAPYEVAVYQPQQDALDAAHDFLRLELAELEDLLAAGDPAAWEHTWERQVTPLTREEAIG